MKLGTGKLNSSIKKGFSIIEVLIVLALIALVTGIFAVNFDVLLNSFSKKTPEKLLHEVIREARYQASYTHSEVALLYDKKAEAFHVINENGHVLAEFKNESKYGFTFLTVPLVLYKGGMFSKVKSESSTLEGLMFNPDGSSTPANVEVTTDAGKTRLWIDPFSNGVMLES